MDLISFISKMNAMDYEVVFTPTPLRGIVVRVIKYANGTKYNYQDVITPAIMSDPEHFSHVLQRLEQQVPISIRGMMREDDSIPKGEIHFQQNGRTTAKLANIK